MRILVLILAVAIASPVAAKCKFKHDDDGLERGKRYTVAAKMTSYVRIEYWRREGDYFLNALVGTVLSGMDATVTATDTLDLELVGGDVLTLVPLTESESRRTFLGFGVNRKLSGGIYHLSSEAVASLVERDVMTITFNYSDGGTSKARNWNTRKGDRKNFKRGAVCLLQEDS